MPTPVKWKDKFQVNTGDAATGGQHEPRIIGLAGGFILVVWTEDAAGTVGDGAGKNIIGKIYDPLSGSVVVEPKQLNSRSTVDDEQDFDIAPTADGGFILVYVDDDIASPNQTGIIWELLDPFGGNVDSTVIAEENVETGETLANPQVTVNLQTGQSMITFSHLAGFDNDLRGRLVSADGVAGAEFDAAQNGADFAGSGDVAILANGNYVSVYRESDSGFISAEARILTGAGTLIDNLTLSSAIVGTVTVATLANGNWVAAWSETGVGNGDIKYAIYRPTGGAPVAGPLSAASGTNIQATPDVVALRDGGFVIVWTDDSTAVIEAQRFTAAGVADGAVFEIENGGGSDPDVAVMADGRLLFTWVAPNGEISASIWDPRGPALNVADYATGARNFLDAEFNFAGTPAGDTIDGSGIAGELAIYGMDGNDILIGGSGGSGRLEGGNGNDILIGGPGGQFMQGGPGDDTYYVDDSSDTIVEFAGQGDDTLLASGDYTLAAGASVETMSTASQAGTAAISLSGNAIAQSIFGNEGNNQLLGLGGMDQLIGYGGNDVLVGGTGIDVLRGGLGNDLYGIDDGDLIFELVGEGDDTLAANIGSYFLTDGASIESLTTANQAATVAQNLTGNDFGQSVSGSEGANVLNGLGGIDLLRGYGGADIFLFDTAPNGSSNYDVIADMQVGVDKIALQNAVFTGLSEGNLGSGQFRIGSAAQDADDRIIWNQATNQLFFDADGSGAGAAILFAIVNGSPSLTASDFMVI